MNKYVLQYYAHWVRLIDKATGEILAEDEYLDAQDAFDALDIPYEVEYPNATPINGVAGTIEDTEVV